MSTLLDLRKLRGPFLTFLCETIHNFRTKHPTEEISAVVAYAFLFERVVGLCLDTKSNSDAHVRKWKSKGPAWYGEDAFGYFNDSPEDFAFPDFADFEFAWPNLYESGGRIEIVDHSGLIAVANLDADGDEGLNRAIFPSLCAFARECDAWTLLRRSSPFRLGVVMHDSKCEELWALS